MSAPTNFQVTGCNSFWKIHCFHFFLQKRLCYQIWPCRKIGQGHSRVIIWTNYDKQESPMLHTKFRGSRPAGSRVEDFWRVFTIYGRGGHLGHVTQMPRTNFCFPNPRRLHIRFGFDWPIGFREEDVWNCERRTTTTDGRTPDHEYTISSPLSLRLRWAKKIHLFNDRDLLVTGKHLKFLQLFMTSVLFFANFSAGHW